MRAEKLDYIHQNPVKRRLVREPEHWVWHSYRHYAYGESGPVLMNEDRYEKGVLRSHPSKIAKGGAASVWAKGKGRGVGQPAVRVQDCPCVLRMIYDIAALSHPLDERNSRLAKYVYCAPYNK